MSLSGGDASRLLRQAFPWGAFVDLGGNDQLVSLSYEVVEKSHDDGTALLRFERDAGDTRHLTTGEQLAAAAASGVLHLGGAAIRRPEPDDMVLMAEPLRDFIGPQAGSDDPWKRRMRLHQSWWRTFRLRRPFGFGPGPDSTSRYGNMLDDAGADAHANFLSADAHEAFVERCELSRTGVDRWRTSRNLLASQPMAFNLFGHLRHHPPLATSLVRSLLGDDGLTVTGVELERLSDALGDHTAFDAFVTYDLADGGSGCLAVETKLTEPFSQKAYEWSRYIDHDAFDPTDWTTTDPVVLGDPRWSQLWRNHLLARAEAKRGSLGQATVLVVYHPQDPHCAANVDEYRTLLTDPESIRAVDLRTIVGELRRVTVGDPGHERWAEDLNDRYLDLGRSEPLLPLTKRDGRRETASRVRNSTAR